MENQGASGMVGNGAETTSALLKEVFGYHRRRGCRAPAARWVRELGRAGACMQTRAHHVYMRASHAHGRNSSAIPHVDLIKT